VPIDSLSVNSCGSACSCSTDSQVARGSVHAAGRTNARSTANQQSPSVRTANHISVTARPANHDHGESTTTRSANREAALGKPANQETARPAGPTSPGGGESRRVKVEYLGSIPVESKATDLRSLQVSLVNSILK
jgi:hypothetical protein